MLTHLGPSPRKETAYTNFDVKESSANVSVQRGVSAKSKSALPEEMAKFLRAEAASGLDVSLQDLIGDVKPVYSIIVPYLQSNTGEEAVLNNQTEKICKRWRNAVNQAGIEEQMDVLNEGIRWLVITASLKG